MRQSIINHKNVRLVPFQWFHPHLMDLRPFERALMSDIPNFDYRLQMFEAEGGAVSAMVGNKIACCFGAIKYWPGVAECWMLTGKQVADYPVTLTRSAKRYFDDLMHIQKLHRLQITVDTANDLAIRWANALQFRQEGLMRQYGVDRSDHAIYARYS